MTWPCAKTGKDAESKKKSSLIGWFSLSHAYTLNQTEQLFDVQREIAVYGYESSLLRAQGTWWKKR